MMVSVMLFICGAGEKKRSAEPAWDKEGNHDNDGTLTFTANAVPPAPNGEMTPMFPRNQ